MVAQQAKRVSMPVEAQQEKQSSFASLWNSYVYNPMKGTPSSLLAQSIETQYEREVSIKLKELKRDIEAISRHMLTQSELLSTQVLHSQDQVDRSLAALL